MPNDSYTGHCIVKGLRANEREKCLNSGVRHIGTSSEPLQGIAITLSSTQVRIFEHDVSSVRRVVNIFTGAMNIAPASRCVPQLFKSHSQPPRRHTLDTDLRLMEVRS